MSNSMTEDTIVMDTDTNRSGSDDDDHDIIYDPDDDLSPPPTPACGSAPDPDNVATFLAADSLDLVI